MTSENKMREALEEIKDLAETFHCELGENWRDIKSIAESALHSVEAEKEPDWISCEKRLPTEEDGPKVWLCWEGQISLQSWFDVCVPNKDQWATAHNYPAPPEHKPE